MRCSLLRASGVPALTVLRLGRRRPRPSHGPAGAASGCPTRSWPYGGAPGAAGPRAGGRLRYVAGDRLRVHYVDWAAGESSTEFHAWKRLLVAAGVAERRLHDARHTAATVLLLLGVPERTVMSLMGWSSTATAARYQHVGAAMRRGVADQVSGLLWTRRHRGARRQVDPASPPPETAATASAPQWRTAGPPRGVIRPFPLVALAEDGGFEPPRA